MARYKSYKYRRVLPVVITVAIIIIAIVILVTLMRAILFPPQQGDTEKKVDITQSALLDTSADRMVRMVVRGPIVADENFRSYRITVSPQERKVETFRGYLSELVEQKSLGNNVKAYEEFVHALNRAEMTRGVQFEGDKNDVRGICASGRVTEFSLIKGSEVVEMLWTSSCGGSPGSLRASSEQLHTLFTRQVPDSNAIIRNMTF